MNSSEIMMHLLDFLITAVPFVIYSATLVKLHVVWCGVRQCKECARCKRLASVVGILAVCTLLFIIANAYALLDLGKTLFSMRVFQMFVVGNCVAYWLVLDLVAKDADHEGDNCGTTVVKNP